MTPREQLMTRAIELLREHGWCHTSPAGVGPDGSICAAHAVGFATSQLANAGTPADEHTWNAENVALHAALVRLIRQDHPDLDIYSVPLWNDTIARDVDEVIDLLKRAVDA